MAALPVEARHTEDAVARPAFEATMVPEERSDAEYEYVVLKLPPAAPGPVDVEPAAATGSAVVPSTTAGAAALPFPRLLRLYEDRDFCFRWRAPRSNFGRGIVPPPKKPSSGTAGATTITQRQQDYLMEMNVKLASSGVDVSESTQTRWGEAAASLSSPRMAEPFAEAARFVESWAVSANPPTGSPAPFLSVEQGGSIVMRIHELKNLPLAKTVYRREERPKEPRWTEAWLEGHGPIINAVLELINTAQNAQLPSSLAPLPLLRLVDVNQAALYGRAHLWFLLKPDLVLFSGDQVAGLVEVKNRHPASLARATQPTLGGEHSAKVKNLLEQLFVQTVSADVACAAILGDFGQAFVPFELQRERDSAGDDPSAAAPSDLRSAAAEGSSLQDQAAAGAPRQYHLSFANEAAFAELDRAEHFPAASASRQSPHQIRWASDGNMIMWIVRWALYAQTRAQRPGHVAQHGPLETWLAFRFFPENAQAQVRAARHARPGRGEAALRRKDVDEASQADTSLSSDDFGSASGASAVLSDSAGRSLPRPGDIGDFLYVPLAPFSQSEYANVYRAWRSSCYTQPEPALPRPHLRSVAPAGASSCIIKAPRQLDAWQTAEDEDEDEHESPRGLREERERVEEANRRASCEADAYLALAPLQGLVVPRLLYAGPFELPLQGKVSVLLLEDVGGAPLYAVDPATVVVSDVRAAVVAAYVQLHAAGWCHHDVAQRNIMLLDDGRAVIIDLETARREAERYGEGEMMELDEVLDLWATGAPDYEH